MTDSVLNLKEKINDDNMSHFNRYTKERGARDARRIYRSVFAGDISTLGREDSRVAGYPFGSVTPFMIDYTGSPVIFTANIAEHSKNALSTTKASLMVRQVARQHQIETGWRLTCVGDLKKITGKDFDRVSESYFRYYPEAKEYEITHEFYLFRLNITVARVIMGFGKISWVEAKDLVMASPFSQEEEKQMIEHMNDTHEPAIKHYLKNLGVSVGDNLVAPRIVAINQLGAVIDYQHHLYFVEFDEMASNVGQARQQLVKLAKA